MLITKEQRVTDDKGELIAMNLSTTFIKGLGGFGDKGTYKITYQKKPKRNPDHIAFEYIAPNQAFLYRLSGDWNPLHVDPDRAAVGGFDKPILHGLCSFGITGRAVYSKYCNNEPSNFKKIASRFTSHVFPGETLEINMWKEDNIVIFETKTKERGKVCLIGYVELREPAAKL